MILLLLSYGWQVKRKKSLGTQLHYIGARFAVRRRHPGVYELSLAARTVFSSSFRNPHKFVYRDNSIILYVLPRRSYYYYYYCHYRYYDR